VKLQKKNKKKHRKKIKKNHPALWAPLQRRRI
jgi:hypothetical protein